MWIRGEDAAAKHMKRAGFRILERNARFPMGEIDIVCLEPRFSTLVIVEVKARMINTNPARRIDPEANITSTKKAKLRTLAQAAQRSDRYPSKGIRIDVIAVEFVDGQSKPVALRHYESAV